MEKYSYNFYNSTNSNIKFYISKVYAWMACGLLITSFISWYITKIPFILEMMFFNRIFLFTILISQIIIVFILSNMINKISVNTAILLFIIYSILTGISISSLFLIYTYSSITISFFVCSLMFSLMSIWGYYSKSDLTKIGNISLILLIGMIISTLINNILKSNLIVWITSYLGILSFCILIAWDTQKLKEIGLNILNNNDNNNEQLKKYSILGALILYLDFINLYLIILKLAGIKNKNNNNKNKNKY